MKCHRSLLMFPCFNFCSIALICLIWLMGSVRLCVTSTSFSILLILPPLIPPCLYGWFDIGSGVNLAAILERFLKARLRMMWNNPGGDLKMIYVWLFWGLLFRCAAAILWWAYSSLQNILVYTSWMICSGGDHKILILTLNLP